MGCIAVLQEQQTYIPGEFYIRKLPCILTLLKQINQALDEMVVDGYVMLGDRPGLGKHLFKSFEGEIPVVGVAKSKFEGSLGAEIYRGGSIHPLYVTSAGVDLQKVSEKIRTMHGVHRIPTLLKQVDFLAISGFLNRPFLPMYLCFRGYRHFI